jgi:hypothetical protein
LKRRRKRVSAAGIPCDLSVVLSNKRGHEESVRRKRGKEFVNDTPLFLNPWPCAFSLPIARKVEPCFIAEEHLGQTEIKNITGENRMSSMSKEQRRSGALRPENGRLGLRKFKTESLEISR